MSDNAPPSTGQVSVTPEGGPIDQGVPASAPGAGQVQATPEAGPPTSDEMLVPPTWREHMKGPILGLDDAPAASATPPSTTGAGREEPAAAFTGGEPGTPGQPSARTARDEEELKHWPPYSGKPVSEINRNAMKYAAPVVAQAEKLTIKAIDLSARGLSKLARYLETRRQEREGGDSGSR
jgi:hypothetical protein